MTNYDILKEYEAHKTPVPSYEEWRDLQDDLATCDKDLNNVCEQKEELYEENQQLKELLLECSEFLHEIITGTQLKLSFKLESGIRKKYYMMSLSELKTKIDNAIGEKK